MKGFTLQLPGDLPTVRSLHTAEDFSQTNPAECGSNPTSPTAPGAPGGPVARATVLGGHPEHSTQMPHLLEVTGHDGNAWILDSGLTATEHLTFVLLHFIS